RLQAGPARAARPRAGRGEQGRLGAGRGHLLRGLRALPGRRHARQGPGDAHRALRGGQVPRGQAHGQPHQQVQQHVPLERARQGRPGVVSASSVRAGSLPLSCCDALLPPFCARGAPRWRGLPPTPGGPRGGPRIA
ncbi:unnamed protein product, partial [Prorocentrum cordatum]